MDLESARGLWHLKCINIFRAFFNEQANEGSSCGLDVVMTED